MDVNIQIIENEVDVNQIPIYTGLVGGQPKTGKTTQCASWSDKGRDGVLLIDTDMGADLVDSNRIPVTSINPPIRKVKTETGTKKVIIPPEERGYIYRAGQHKGEPMPVYSLTEVYSWIQERITSNDFPYDTIVIDTIDAINEWVEQAVMKKMQIDSMGQAGYGNDWFAAKEKNLKILDNFIDLWERNGINGLLVCHTKQRSVISDGTVQESPALPRGLSSVLQGKMTFICNVKRNDKGKPYADFKAYSEKQVGSRIKALNNKQIPFSYQAFKETIQNFKEDKKEN